MVLTRQARFSKAGNVLTQTETETRVTDHTYDWRGRKTGSSASDGVNVLLTTSEYDDLDRLTATANWKTAAGVNANRIARTDLFRDTRGRVWKTETRGADGSGNLTAPLTALTWFGYCGAVIKSIAAGQKAAVKIQLDSLGRETLRALVVDAASEAVPEGPVPAGASPQPWGGTLPKDISGDIVIEQTETEYNQASEVLAVTLKRRFHSATGTGSLNGPSGAEPKSRNTFTALWYDGAGRQIAAADYGTNGGSAFTRPDTPPASSSDTVHVSRVSYNPEGEAWQTEAADGTLFRIFRDAAGRETESLENAGGPLTRSVTKTWTPGGNLLSFTLNNPDTGAQTTRFEYGTTLATSGLADPTALRRKTFPDGGQESYTRNRLGEVVTLTDPRGVVRVLERDELGRQIHDRVTNLPSGVDGTVLRLSTAYNNRGQTAARASHDHATPGNGSVVNEAAFTHNAFGQFTADCQSLEGETGAGSPRTDYAYADGSAGTIRRVSETLTPGGTTTETLYGSAGSIDDTINRVTSKQISGESEALAVYEYMGAGILVSETFPEPGAGWQAYGSGTGPAGDIHHSFDRFGNLADKTWKKGATSLVSAEYGYDVMNRRVWRKDQLATGRDRLHTYDVFSQVTGDQRGTLNGAHDAIGSQTADEAFTYDLTGNWNGYEHFTGATQDIDQIRSHNTSNQILTVSEDGSPLPVLHDAAGNTVQTPTGSALDGAGRKLVWDAWNRLVEVRDAATDALIQRNRYDALHRRTTREEGATKTGFVYNGQWRCAGEYDLQPSSLTLHTSHYWGVNRWDYIARDSVLPPLPPGEGGGEGSVERHYCLSDALDPAAVTDASGTVVERYDYTAFGRPEVLAANFTPKTGNETTIDWRLRFHLEFEDPATGWHNYGYWFYNPDSGRWLNRDPIGERGGMNLYGFVGNGATIRFDTFGLSPEQNVGSTDKPEKPCLFNGSPAALTFDGSTISGSGLSLGAVSGKPGINRNINTLREDNSLTESIFEDVTLTFDHSRRAQRQKDHGPTPEGNYWINTCDTNSSANAGRHKKWRPDRFAWGDYSWHIRPDSGTDVSSEGGGTRDKMFLHGGQVPGSKGCIDAFCGGDSEIQKLVSRLKDECGCCYITIRVQYKQDEARFNNKTVHSAVGGVWQTSSSGWREVDTAGNYIF